MQNNSTSLLSIKNLPGVVQQPRTFHSKLLKTGSPNLLVVPPGEKVLSLWWFVLWIIHYTYQLLQLRFCCTVTSMKIKSCTYSTCINAIFSHLSLCADQVLKTALSLYMEDKTLPLPTFEEILICTPSTTSEEVRLIALDSVFHL